MNEAALKQIEIAHENFKIEVFFLYFRFWQMNFLWLVSCSAIYIIFFLIWQAEKLKKSLEAEIGSLRERVSELENESSLKSEEIASATAGKEEALSSALAEIRSVKEESAVKRSNSSAECYVVIILV